MDKLTHPPNQSTGKKPPAKDPEKILEKNLEVNLENHP
jgi:hypothetical protein